MIGSRVVRRALPLCALLAATGCATPDPGARSAQRITPLAYELVAPNGSRALLLGSIHLARADDWVLPRPILEALERSDALVFEIDLARTSADEMMALMLDVGVLPPDRRLRDQLSEATWHLLEERAPQHGLSLDALDRLEPWVVALQFMGRSLSEAGFETEHGVEQGVWNVAGSKPVRGLETPLEQFRVFDQLEAPLQERMLRDALAPPDGPTLEALVNAWRRGDVVALEAILFEDRNDPLMAPLHQATYPRRNLRMAASLTNILLEVRHAFVVVGVGHLVGKRSLPAALARSGYRVERLRYRR
jgi:uncharacterized protein YbaP (TraB family)